MKVCIFGLGYVGSVMMGCLSRAGHRVVGIDVKAEKVDLLNSGVSPVIEPGLNELIEEGHKKGLLSATTEPSEALDEAEISFICVGTPSKSDGSIETATVLAVCEQIGSVLQARTQQKAHTIVIRSTVVPGTIEKCKKILEKLWVPPESTLGTPINLCLNPEFLREGSAIDDFLSPPFTLVGTSDRKNVDAVKEVYAFLEAPFVITTTREAELLKMVCNAWHATKVCFTNEVSRLCCANGADPRVVMDLFTQDQHLNLSATYLSPGFAYGGSCLPKDIGALVHLARHSNAELPLLEGVPKSNTIHIELAKSAIVATQLKRIGFLGLSFKPGTDDLRGSPIVDLAEFCKGKGYEVNIFDPNVQPSRLVGRNREVALERLGHLAELLVDNINEIQEKSDLVVLGHKNTEFAQFCQTLGPKKHIFDLVGLLNQDQIRANYTGLCW